MITDASLPEALPGFRRLAVQDGLGRRICFCLSGPSEGALPLAGWIQGSGCHGLFRLLPGGGVQVRQQGVLRQALDGRARVVAVEKPGTGPFDDPGRHGRAQGCPAAFLQEHTLDRWAEAVGAVLRALLAAGLVAPGQLLLLGQSEGGVVAARLSAMLPEVSHVALAAASGFGQAGELALAARATAARRGLTPDEAEEEFHRIWTEIRTDPESAARFAWGHPFRRWSGFLKASTLDELLVGRAAVLILHGTADRVVHPAAAVLLRAELVRHGRRAALRLISRAGHGLARHSQSQGEALAHAYAEVARWFFDDVDGS